MTRNAIAAALARGHDPRGRSDAALVAGEPGLGPIPAGVLVPLVEHADGLTILLTQRTAHLSHHAGQISFPGGRLEECDGGCGMACALRETYEEIGLTADRVEILGRLDDYVTGTGFRITPVVGITAPPLTLALDSFEVAEVFEVPLAHLVDPAQHSRRQRDVGGQMRPYWAIPWQHRLIWGATAGILINLAEVLGHRGR